MALESLQYFKDDQIDEGLLYLLNSYSKLILGFTPAHILTIISISVSIVICLLLVSQLTLVQEASSYCGHSAFIRVLKAITDVINDVLGIVIYAVSLIWLVQILFMLLTWIQGHAKPIYILAPFILCFVGIFVSWILVPGNVTSTANNNGTYPY